MDTKRFKQQLNTDEIITLVESLGGTLTHQTNSECIFTSICCKLNADLHSPKLYYYKQSHRFYCYKEGQAYDIFSLVEAVWMLHDKEFYFGDVVDYVLSVLGYSEQDFRTKPKVSWRDDAKLFVTHSHKGSLQHSYPISDLKRFDDKLPLAWINEGIGLDSMKRYKIGYYALDDCTTIPVFDINGELVGIRGRYWRPEDITQGKYRPITTLHTTYKFATGGVLYGLYQNQSAIKRTRTIWLVEGEKSVLKSDTWFGANSVAAALFGSSISKQQIRQIIELGAEKVVVMLDSDFQNIGDQDYSGFVERVDKMAKALKPYFNVEVCYNNIGLNGYKYSPFDFSRSEFDKMYENREVL